MFFENSVRVNFQKVLGVSNLRIEINGELINA
jgi:hypothetical protein